MLDIPDSRPQAIYMTDISTARDILQGNYRAPHPLRPYRGPLCLGGAIGVFLGLALIGGIHETHESEAYRQGELAGRAHCQDPSRLQKAAKWLTK